eukprot:CAMPEP_0206570788 /NCGR_PEP_ID=MMETSP0325_2-20121206/27245_1 /ASSEMBLY_ACC=CAM_ASM_000347 /TAXON_ID=2866 /ORGANISM="Crypthecodinium cohnii, Strain Seligo" /LENGTH=48 /DNA_ID= /DNA_START= /DNA_END= /DNA_ORIENTATION=
MRGGREGHSWGRCRDTGGMTKAALQTVTSQGEGGAFHRSRAGFSPCPA